MRSISLKLSCRTLLATKVKCDIVLGEDAVNASPCL